MKMSGSFMLKGEMERKKVKRKNTELDSFQINVSFKFELDSKDSYYVTEGKVAAMADDIALLYKSFFLSDQNRVRRRLKVSRRPLKVVLTRPLGQLMSNGRPHCRPVSSSAQ